MYKPKQPLLRINKPGRCESGFTLIEMLLVVSIIAILFSLSFPQLSMMLDRADSVRCGSNLRVVGVAANLAANDNDNNYPAIEPDPSNPIYQPSDHAQSLYDALKNYGIVATTLRCPSDAKRHNYYLQKGTSYEWRPYLDDEPVANPQIYNRNGTSRVVKLSKFRLVIDTDACHHGHQNRLYADGHVVTY